MKKNLSKFRINLVPQDTEVLVKRRGFFSHFKLFLKQDCPDDLFSLLETTVKSIPEVKEDLTQHPVGKGYYYVLTTPHGTIRFEINYGGKYVVSSVYPPTISIETTPYIPPLEFLEEIKPAVKHLVKRTGFKIFFWDAMKFLEVDQLYGRMK